MRGGTQRNVSASPLNPRNTNTPSTPTVTSKPTPSTTRPQVQGKRPGALQRTRNGPTIRAPTASPSHHVNQIAPKSRQLAEPLSVRLVTPIVALTVVRNSAASTTNLKTSRARSKTLRPFANSLTRSAPRRPSIVLPMAMPIEVAIAPLVVTLTRNAPTRMAGHTRGPSTRKAASAIPVGGHTGETLAWTNARVSPNLPAPP